VDGQWTVGHKVNIWVHRYYFEIEIDCYQQNLHKMISNCFTKEIAAICSNLNA